MADEETKTDEGQVADDKTAENQEAAGSTEETATETETTPEPTEGEKKLTEQMGELQGKFDTLSQSSEQNNQLLEEISPYVDWNGMKAARTGGKKEDVLDEEGDETFVTKKELAAHKKEINQQIKTSEFKQDFRKKYPDVADGGPREELVRFYFEKQKTGSFDKKLESAVKATRDIFKDEQNKGKELTKAEEEKAVAEAKAKSEEAAKASGLSSGGITSPNKSDEGEAQSTGDYVNERKAKLEKLRTHT